MYVFVYIVYCSDLCDTPGMKQEDPGMKQKHTDIDEKKTAQEQALNNVRYYVTSSI